MRRIVSFPKGIVLLSAASLFTDIGSEALFPLLPVYFTTVLGASVASLGLIEGVAEATAAIFKLISGASSDRMGRGKILVLGGYSLSNAMKPLLGLATTWPQALWLRFFDRMGKGVRSAPRDAWLAKLSTKETWPAVYGFHRGMDHLGAVIGPLLASLFLFFRPGDIRNLFLLSIVPGVLSLACIAWASEPKTASDLSTQKPLHWRDFFDFPTPLKRTLFIIFCFTLGNSTDAFLLLRLKDAGFSDSAIPLFWAALHVVRMLVSFGSARVCEELGTVRTIALGWLVFALVYLALGVAGDTRLIAILFLVYGLFNGLTEGPEKALIARLTPPQLHGSAFGCYGMAVALATLPASVIFGVLWQTWGTRTAFGFGAGIAFLSMAALLHFVREESPPTAGRPI